MEAGKTSVIAFVGSKHSGMALITQATGMWDKIDGGQLVLLEGIRRASDRHGVLIHNPSDESVVISKGRILGRMEVMEEEALAMIQEYNGFGQSSDGVQRNSSGGWEGRPSHEFVMFDKRASDEDQKEFRKFIEAEGKDIFEEVITGVSKLDPMPIDLVNEKEPVVWRSGARVPYRWRSFIDEKKIGLEKIGAIRKSISEFNAPVMVVPKPGGGLPRT